VMYPRKATPNILRGDGTDGMSADQALLIACTTHIASQATRLCRTKFWDIRIPSVTGYVSRPRLSLCLLSIPTFVFFRSMEIQGIGAGNLLSKTIARRIYPQLVRPAFSAG
jgi:hypothetical protein